MQIIVLTCKVNICNQDLGVFCRERDLEGKKHIGEGQGATEPAPGEDVGVLMEVGSRVGGVEWCAWALLAIMDAVAWLWELRSLLGRLWWHWVFLGDCKDDPPPAAAACATWPAR